MHQEEVKIHVSYTGKYQRNRSKRAIQKSSGLPGEEDQKLEAGVRMAEKLIDSGAALKKLNEFIACSNE